jgi:hypothetical protein
MDLSRRSRRDVLASIVAFSLVAVALAGCGGSPAVPATAHWTVSIFPGQSSLSGVSCASTTNCMAVGLADSSDADAAAIWAQYAHRSWRFQAHPEPNRAVVLHAITCATRSECLAVGGETTTVPRCGYGVCTPVDATSADAYFGPVVETWNGSAWSDRRVPLPTDTQTGDSDGQFNGISCVSRHACVAVGQYRDVIGQERPLAESWNGTSWMLMRTPVPGDLVGADFSAVSCARPSDCVAVGSSVKASTLAVPFAESWNGLRWTPSSVRGHPTANALTAVVCPSNDACFAVGDAGTSGFLEEWTGNRWTSLATLSVPRRTIGLTGISCPGGTCTAVGWVQGVSAAQALAAQWEGRAWKMLAIDRTASASPKGLSAVSCPSPHECVAVGDTDFGSQGQPAVAGSFSF